MSFLRRGKGIFIARDITFALATLSVALALSCTAQASAQTLAPWWSITSAARPSQLKPGPCGGKVLPPCPQIIITAENVGDAASSGPVTITDQLPSTLTAVAIKAVAGGPGAFARGPVSCSTAKGVKCVFEKNEKGEPGSLPPFEVIEVRLSVEVKPSATSGELNSATVSGGGATAPVSTSHPIAVGGEDQFGFEEYSLIPEAEDGALETQAGSHPFQLSSVITLNSRLTELLGSEEEPKTVGLPRSISGELAPGFVGNLTAAAQCTDEQFGANVKAPLNSTGEPQQINACPDASAVGVVTVTVNEPNVILFATLTAPIFNMVPNPGEPARFGFKAAGTVSAFLDTTLRSGTDYGIDVSSLNITQIAWLMSARLTLWGVPSDPAHSHLRGWDCLQELGGASACPSKEESSKAPLLTLPTACGPFQSTLQGQSWGSSAAASVKATPLTYTLPQPLSGCESLPFAPEIKVSPHSSAASTPSGLDADIHIPQQALQEPDGLAQSALKDLTLTLPEGLTLNASAANGLEACSEGLAGFTGFAELQQGSQSATFTPKLPEPLQPGVNFCPDASKVANVEVTTPLLEGDQHLKSPENPEGSKLKGALYLASQNENPFGSLIAAYLVLEDPTHGVLVRQAGEAQLSQSGQITATLKNIPPLPFEDADVSFFDGPRAALGTPAHCAPYTTNASLVPWSGTQAVSASSAFQITQGPGGGPCPSQPLPFTPTLSAGSESLQAGAFSALSTTIARQDGSQDLSAVTLHTPLGFSGVLTGIPLCQEAQANAGTCPQASRIGDTTVTAGLGQDPVTVSGGGVYLTESYAGAPFGLSITSPAKAGPFDLENTATNHPPCDCVVVRAKVQVDPLTAQLTVTTDTQGPYAIPRQIDGVPVQLRHVNVKITRPGFSFNPTSCEPQSITGSASGSEGAAQPLSVSFQLANCAALAFKPKFEVQTSGKTSKANGTSLHVKLSYPKAPFGSQANIASVKVELPKQLPSRLTTLQKACLAATFEQNFGASCPAASIVGHAKVTTPVLPVPLEGNAYFVSHGNEAFPNLTIVLKGYGVTVGFVGSTLIKKGITSNTFKATPDVPFETFELTLPQGPYSALTANTSLCAKAKTTTTKKRVTIHRNGKTIHTTRKVRHTTTVPGPTLLMPTSFIAQNGATLTQKTKVGVGGCVKVARRKGKGKAGAKKR